MDANKFVRNNFKDEVDVANVRYPHCIVWTPIPILTWIFPLVGHMGIARTDGVIRDFAGSYYVSVRNESCLLEEFTFDIENAFRKMIWPLDNQHGIFN